MLKKYQDFPVLFISKRDRNTLKIMLNKDNTLSVQEQRTEASRKCKST